MVTGVNIELGETTPTIGLNVVQSCKYATTGPIRLAGQQTVDGVVVQPSDRVLVKDQEDKTENGIYEVDYPWRRVTEPQDNVPHNKLPYHLYDGCRREDGPDDLSVGTFTFIECGDMNSQTSWACTDISLTDRGTEFSFAQISSAPPANEPWFAPAGLQRGALRVDNIDTSERIYNRQVTQRTRDDLENLIRPYLYEYNDQQTRHSIQHTLTRYMDTLMDQRAIYDYSVMCDERNNSPTRIDNGELHADIMIRPRRGVDEVHMNLRLQNHDVHSDGNFNDISDWLNEPVELGLSPRGVGRPVGYPDDNEDEFLKKLQSGDMWVV